MKKVIRRGRIELLFQLIVGVLLLLWLFQLVRWEEIAKLVQHIKVIDLVLASFFFIAASTFTALILCIGIKRFWPKAPIGKVILASFGGQLISDVTPARVGYFLTPLLLKQYGIPVSIGMTSTMLTGVANFSVKGSLACFALLYFAFFLPFDFQFIMKMLIGISFLSIGAMGLSLLLWGKRLAKVMRKLPFLAEFSSAVRELQKRGEKVKHLLLPSMLLMLLSTLSAGLALYFVYNSIWHSSPSLLDFFLMVPLASALMFIPITVAGLGLQEAGYVFILSLLGTPLEVSLVFALMTRALFTSTDAIGLPSILLYFRKKYSRRSVGNLGSSKTNI